MKHMALNKLSPPLNYLFFQEEALEISPIERFSHYKFNLLKCRISSSKKAFLTAKEEEEYNILKTHVKINTISWNLQVKYPF